MRNKKFFISLLFIVIIFTITIGYSLMNRNLNITGNSSVSKNTWDIHFENIEVRGGSVNASTPIINSEKDLVNFSFNLDLPGDYYQFSVDVVNSGTIDGMIDSILKTPELSDSQKKYLNYIIEYENGEEIFPRQLIPAGEFVKIKVRVEYRDDILETDLPTVNETLNLGFTINYIQGDSNGVSVKDNGVSALKVISGTGFDLNDEVCIGEECFYVMYSDKEKVTLFSKYNLNVGNKVVEWNTTALVNPTGRQDKDSIGFDGDGGTSESPNIGTIAFSPSNYWSGRTSFYPSYVYSNKSTLYTHIENYKTYLTGLGININDVRPIKVEELENLNCSKGANSCSETYSWVYSSTYWTGSADNANDLWLVHKSGFFGIGSYYFANYFGLRPVIEIPRTSYY